MNARTNALARQDDAIDTNIAKIETAKKASALEALASRLNISPVGLKNTLLNTVFKGANDDEFAALIIVANEYNLNPLLKQMWAFPSKGGIVPMVSIDGWIAIAERHPMMDGFEQNDIADESGKLIGVETSIWRKDRSRPVKVTAYLDEFKRNTDPWNKMPAHMLGNKSFGKAVRFTFGVTGLYDDDDNLVGEISLGGDAPPPMRSATRIIDQSQDVPPHDEQTGELIDDEQEPARDAQGFTRDPFEDKADELIARSKKVETAIDFNALAADFDREGDGMPQEIWQAVETALNVARDRLDPRKG